MVNRDWGFSSLRLAAAAILLIAAFAKVWHYPLILKGDGFLANQIVLDAAIVFEAIAAVAIVASGAKLCWWMIVSVYGLFTIVSAFALLTDSECNCFGAWFGASVTMPLDLAILVACAVVRIRNPNLLRISHSNSRLILFGISGLVVGLGLVMGGHYRLQTSSRDNGTRFLLATEMIGKPWPIHGAMNPLLRELESGKWLVIVARRDCEHCAQLLQAYFSDPSRHPAETRTVQFIAGRNDWSFHLDRLTLIGTPTGTVSWSIEPFVASSALFLLDRGLVQDAADGSDADSFASRLQLTH